MCGGTKRNLELTWLNDPSLEDADVLLPPEAIAQEIVEDQEAALGEFAAVADALSAARCEAGGRPQVSQDQAEATATHGGA